MTTTLNGHAPNGATAPLSIGTWTPQPAAPATPPRPRPTISGRVIAACYATMAAVAVIATGVGFWLSYAGLHSFAVQAGLSGPEAWAWPASVDLFILAGELGITISTLRDGRPDWRAWGYFAAGCLPSVTFNVLHVTSRFPWWGKYAVAATPPVAAVLALAALMQQVISLPDALAHLHARQQPGTVAVVSPVAAPVVTGDSGDDKPPATAKAELEETAAREGVSVRTIQRRRAKAKGSTT